MGNFRKAGKSAAEFYVKILKTNINETESKAAPKQEESKEEKLVVSYEVHGYDSCGYYRRAANRAKTLSKDSKIVGGSRPAYKGRLAKLRKSLHEGQRKASGHTSSPFVIKITNGKRSFV